MVQKLIILAPGGLGNQLFTLVAALHISEKNGRKILILSDNKELVAEFSILMNSNRTNSKVAFLYSKRLNLFLNKLSSRIAIFCRRFPKSMERWTQRFRTVDIPWEFPSDLTEKKSKRIWVLRGYFQDTELLIKLSSPNKRILLRLFGIDLSLNTSDEIEKNKMVGVHIRRGDYTSIPSYGLLTIEYFKRLISQYEQDCSTVMLASDDLAVLQQFHDLKSISVLHPLHNSPMTTMKKLMKTTVFIMSNSTFSFWVGWVVSLQGGVVIRPTPWFKEHLVPNNYLLIENCINAISEFEK